jgi:hypothetical protein
MIFVSIQHTIEQITYGNFGEWSGNIHKGETRECTVENYLLMKYLYSFSINEKPMSIQL